LSSPTENQPAASPAPPTPFKASASSVEQDDAERFQQRHLLVGLMGAMIAIAVWHLYLRKEKES